MALCSLCRGVPFDRIPPLPRFLKETGWLRLGPGLCFLEPQTYGFTRPDEFGWRYHPDLDSLKNSAPTCVLCSLVHREVQGFIHNVHHGERVGSNALHYKSDKPKRYSFQITGRADEEGFVIWTDDGPNDRIWYVAVFGYGVDEDPLAQIFRGRVVESDASLAKCAVDWVTNCNHHHNCAPESSSTAFPTRLLDIGDSPSSLIKLRETKGGHGSYTTLSYVWGKTPQLTTTTANYNAHLEGLSLHAFPKTMQDAFAVTRRMGVRYIWIDALCIIQDNTLDWQQEAAKMGHVYANSYLTISAAGAADNSDGCFIPRPIRNCATFHYTTWDNINGKLNVFPVPIENETGRMSIQSMPEEPISNRGWCLQERALSRRTLFYAKSQMYFECKEEFSSEDGMRIQGRFLPIDQSSKPISWTNIRTMRDAWDEVVEDYSRRKLTKITDKLPALSGLAERFAQILHDKYLAGLWQNTLFGDLLWNGSYSTPWPPETYISPSWSWAAVDTCQRTFERYRQLDPSEFTPLALIISASVHTAGANPYGEVDGGKIVIQAPLVPVKVVKDLQGDPEGVRERHGYFGFTAAQPGGHLHYGVLDYQINYDTLGGLPVFALVMGRDNIVGEYPGLLVIPDILGGHYSSGGYRRIGFIKLNNTAFAVPSPWWGRAYPIVTLM
ncbi:heterokaryon incompatibility protein-domain-containing protein [Bisporella sp. PMI_857]|nr:heterokaryon incompatibility protein-domain-containing protein [Bisporella sp. PMI_857]